MKKRTISLLFACVMLLGFIGTVTTNVKSSDRPGLWGIYETQSSDRPDLWGMQKMVGDRPDLW
ncbi:hypothetical protein [Clostridium sp. UBA4395]|uniref:hypothetical protein n=1 Tax=Clostridium sp. UBA4395 TaxID=1946360 RepID=UPI0032164A0A